MPKPTSLSPALLMLVVACSGGEPTPSVTTLGETTGDGDQGDGDPGDGDGEPGDGDGEPGDGDGEPGDGDGEPGDGDGDPGDGDGDGPKFDLAEAGDLGGPSCYQCSADLHEVLNCQGAVVETCASDEACDSSNWSCAPACQAMINNKSSIGCEYLATEMDNASGGTTCFAAYVANTWNANLHISLEYDGSPLDIAAYARVPLGFGPNLTLAPYDANVGLAPGEVAVLVLNGPAPTAAACPARSRRRSPRTRESRAPEWASHS